MRIPLLCLALLCTLASLGQFKNDNILYKTVYVQDLCAQLKANPNAVLLDVRSKGEYDDTLSTAASLNIGRLKNTIHLDIREMPARWRELAPHKDKPIYVMCSHSQRSRRVSKMLADSGFTNIINVNGGLTTYNLFAASEALCKDGLYQTNNRYSLVSPINLCGFLSSAKNTFILDVRSDSAFRGITSDERQNAFGKLKGSVNIPLSSLKKSVDGIPSGKKILIVDDFGNDAAEAGRLLTEKGFNDVHVLFNGLDMLMSRSRNEVGCSSSVIERNVKYQTISGDEFDALVKKEKDLVIVDIRPTEEFNNQAKQTFRNAGHIRNAVNIPVSELEKRVTELTPSKNKPVVVYNFSSGGQEAYKAANMLVKENFSKVYVLSGGLFNLRWQAANLKGKSQLKDYVIDIPADNQ
ncbi:MAG TPA: rhodanese-like domain-containing protein [Chitinophagaceae bacterium]